MAALNFPTSPTNGQQYTAPDGSIFEWDAAAGKWKKISIYDNLSVATLQAGHYVEIADSSNSPSPTTNRLYAQGGRLYWNAILLDSDAGGGGGASETANSIMSKIKTVDSDGSGLNADTLDGQQGSYYLAYANFTGTPNVLDSSQVQSIANANYIMSQIKTLDSDTSGLNADTLDGQQGTYYLDYNNFTNIPDPVTANSVMSLIQTLDSDTSGLNADTLDGQQGSYYLAYTNFTGTPNVLDSAQIQAMTDSNELSYTLDFVTGNGNTTTNSITVEDATINGLITISDSTAAPTVTTNKLYAVGGRLYWNAFLLDSDGGGGGGSPITANEIMSKIKTVDSDTSGLNADTLDGQQGSYYLAYANFTGTPNVLDSGQVQSIANANYIMSQIKTLDSDGSGLNADTLDAQQGTYYLDYTNFTNTPDPVTANSVMSLIQTVDSNASGLNADTLDGQQGSYYLAYANFTGTPNVLDSAQIQAMADSNELGYTLDFVTGNGNTTTNSITVEDATINGLITIADSTAAPTVTTNKLYAVGGKLYWNAFVLDSDKFGGGGADETANSILSKLKTIDSDGSGLNADTLDAQQGTYYLDYSNFTNTPDPVTANLVMSLLQTVDSDTSGLNADTLDAQQGSYYLAYANFTGTPNVLDSGQVQGVANANYIMSQIKTLDSDTSGLNADTLDGQQGSYYLAYGNFTGTPNVLDSGNVEGIVSANYVMSLVQTLDSNTSGLNAATLDGQEGSYYLAYGNFTGTPTAFDSANIQSIIDSDYTNSNKNKFDISFQMDSGDNDTYTVSQYSSFPFDINAAYYKTDTGTITAAVKIDGTDITGLSALSLSSAEGNSTASALNSVAVGNTLTIVTSSNAAATNAIITLHCVRT